MLRWAILYVSTAAVMLPLDFAFLGTVGKKLFDRNVGDVIAASPRPLPAVIFYLLYLAGILVFVNGSTLTDWRHNLLYGAAFGFFAYSTFELTNMAMLRYWSWNVVVPDIVWGSVVTAAAGAGGGLLADWIVRRLA